jgi:hypothetical protein
MVENKFACSRRGLMGIGIGAALLPVAGPGAWAAAETRPVDAAFAVWRKGERIGTHKVRFASDAGAMTVRSEIDLAVKMAFITVFRYRQVAEDRWQGGTLVSANYKTDDNGTESVVMARADGNKLVVDGPTGTVKPAIGTMSDLCFWNKAIVRQSGLIDSQTGELAKLDQEASLGVDRIDVGGKVVEADHYRLASTKGRGGEVWYDKGGRLVQAVIQTRGETLDYRVLT